MSKEYRDDDNIELYKEESNPENTAEFNVARRGGENTDDSYDLTNESEAENEYAEEYTEQAYKDSDINDSDILNSYNADGYNERGNGYYNENEHGNRYFKEGNNVNQTVGRIADGTSREYQPKKRRVSALILILFLLLL